MDNSARKDDNVLIKIDDLAFKYNKKQQQFDIQIKELKLPKNEIISLLGPSGSGKTTLLNLLLGYLKPSKGTISIDGDPKMNEIAYIMQENSVYENVSVFNNVFLSAKNSEKWKNIVRKNFLDNYFSNITATKLIKIYNEYLDAVSDSKKSNFIKKLKYFKLIWFLFWNKNNKSKFKFLNSIRLKTLFKSELEQIAQKLGIEKLLNRNVNELSGGQKQRVAFAKGIIKRTALVLMDEPFSALDAKIKESTIDWLINIKKEFNLSIILVTHDQHDAIKISDKIILMDKGEVQQFSNVSQMYENPANLFVAKFIGSPEINFVKQENDISYYIRPYKIHLKKDDNSPYQIISKKNFGDLTHYDIKASNDEVWKVVLNNDDFEIGQKVCLDYSDSDILLFDEKGNRVYEKK
ncbi:ABC transporter ATP-binding protein [Mycoplasmopsis primatum]|uniref:ABC transporter ATP-binding protein n=1 Tax=Mycoplasmopsis primatum TaxID=55604 RepID=UPI0004954073|nr:ABC transporter ATP-binding protein [Mycoplasmopsis primatum]